MPLPESTGRRRSKHARLRVDNLEHGTYSVVGEFNRASPKAQKRVEEKSEEGEHQPKRKKAALVCGDGSKTLDSVKNISQKTF